MREQYKKLPKWARTLIFILGIVGPAVTALGTVVVTVIDVRSKASDAKKGTDASYKSLAPALKELQEIVAEDQERHEETDEDLEQCLQESNDQDKRLIRLESYIVAISQMRNLPAAPAPVEPNGMSSSLPFYGKFFDGPSKKKPRKPSRPVPPSVNKAVQYQQQRVQAMCSPVDPLCGALE